MELNVNINCFAVVRLRYRQYVLVMHVLCMTSMYCKTSLGAPRIPDGSADGVLGVLKEKSIGWDL